MIASTQLPTMRQRPNDPDRHAAGVSGSASARSKKIVTPSPSRAFEDTSIRALAFCTRDLTISAAILYGLSQSPVGLVLQASGQDPVQAGALGFNIVKHKLAAFIVSAFFSGLSGALLVFYFGTASVGTVVDIAVGVQVIVAAVLGGRRTVLGAALGAIFLIVAGEFLRPTGELATFIVSAVALVVILFFPGGFLGSVLSREARS